MADLLGRGAAVIAMLAVAILLIAFAAQEYLQIFARTIAMAAASAALAMALSIPLAWALSEKSRLASIVRPFTILPIVLPAPAFVFIFLKFFGNSGIFNQVAGWICSITGNFTLLSNSSGSCPISFSAYTQFGVVLANALYNFPLVARIVSNAIVSARPYAVVAKTCGASKWDTIASIYTPLCAQSVQMASLLVFFFSFTSFAIPLIFGGYANSNIENELFRLFYYNFDFKAAAVLSIAQIALLAPLVLLIKDGAKIFEAPRIDGRAPNPLSKIVLALHLTGFLSAFLVLFAGAKIVSMPFAPIANSIIFGIITAIIAICGSLLLGRHAKYAFLVYAISPTTIAFALSFCPQAWVLIPIAHAFLAMPIVAPVMQQAKAKIEKYAAVAATCGAGRFASYAYAGIGAARKEIMLGILLAFCVSISEQVIAMSISRGMFDTMSSYTLSAITSYRFQIGQFYAALLALVALALAFTLEWLNGKGNEN